MILRVIMVNRCETMRTLVPAQIANIDSSRHRADTDNVEETSGGGK